MSRFDFKLPDIGEGVSEGEITEWHVKPGDVVKEDQAMVEVMTDKATVTIGAPKAGKIIELGGKVGQVVNVGAVLVSIDTSGGTASSTTPSAPSPSPAHSSSASGTAQQAVAQAKSEGPAATAVGDIRESLPGSSFFSKKANGTAASGSGNGVMSHAMPSGGAETIEYFAEKPLATPATRKLARDLQIDLRRVKPSGPKGRVTKSDVSLFANRSSSTGTTLVGTIVSPQELPTSSPAHVPSRAPIAIRPASAEMLSLEERKPFVGIRRKIAERLQTSKQTAAHFTFVEECDVGKLNALRQRLRPAAEAQGVKLNFLPFIVKAVVAALRKHPVLNSALDETTNELVYRRYYHVGIAAATDQGLMVPVLRNADRLSIVQIASEIDRLGEGARAGTLKSDELTGSTFTITSLGKQGGLFATPVLNFPEVGILGVHQAKQKPVVRDGQIVIGEIMLLSLSFDHRIVDGHVGAAFAYDIIGFLEEPDRLFLET